MEVPLEELDMDESVGYAFEYHVKIGVRVLTLGGHMNILRRSINSHDMELDGRGIICD